MWLWIDPPGDEPGWVHELVDVDAEVPRVLAGYPIPADNDDRRGVDDARPAGAPRTAWGVTLMESLPTDLPAGVVRVARED